MMQRRVTAENIRAVGGQRMVNVENIGAVKGAEEECRWHGAGTGWAYCPLAVPGSICHQQEHLQPKVPLSPSVRVTSLAFPLVQGLAWLPGSRQNHGILGVSLCALAYDGECPAMSGRAG